MKTFVQEQHKLTYAALALVVFCDKWSADSDFFPGLDIIC